MMRPTVVAFLLMSYSPHAFADEPAPPPMVDRCSELARRGDAILAEDASGIRITAGDLVAYVRTKPVSEREYACTADGLAAALDDLVRTRVLASEAHRTGLAERVDVRREVDVVLSRALARETLASNSAMRLSATEVRAYYEAHIADYTRPARVNVLAVWVETARDARRVASMLEGANETKFKRVSSRFSTDRRLRSRRGELGWFSVESAGNDPAIVAAALSLERPAQTTTDPVRTASGDYVWLRLVERVEPEPIPFDELAASVESRMIAERRAALVAELVTRLGARTQLRVAPRSRWLP